MGDGGVGVRRDCLAANYKFVKKADVSYKELAERLTKHGLEEIETGIPSKVALGAFSTTLPTGLSGGAGVREDVTIRAMRIAD